MTFTAPALDVLERYRWPGNVRELQNVLEQAIWQSNSPTIDVENLPSTRAPPSRCVQTRERRADRRRSLRRARQRRLLVLGPRPSALPVPRHHAARHSRAGPSRPAHDARQLPRIVVAVRHGVARTTSASTTSWPRTNARSTTVSSGTASPTRARADRRSFPELTDNRSGAGLRS